MKRTKAWKNTVEKHTAVHIAALRAEARNCMNDKHIHNHAGLENIASASI